LPLCPLPICKKKGGWKGRNCWKIILERRGTKTDEPELKKGKDILDPKGRKRKKKKKNKEEGGRNKPNEKDGGAIGGEA